MNRPHSPTSRRRQRGITLVEAVLYLVIAGGMISLVATMVSDEQKRQQEIVAANGLRLVLEASQRYVAGRYDTIREELFTAAATSGPALMAVRMQALVDEGYIPQNFMNNAAGDGAVNVWGQEYALLMRGVDRTDPAVPQLTMEIAQLDADADNALDPRWTDNEASNGEMEIEALLVTTGGDPVPLNRGGPVIVRSAMASAGLVRSPGFAAGPYGNWELDFSPFETLPEFPDEGRFVSLVALSKFGALDVPVPDESGQYLSRCSDILTELGLTKGSPEYQACMDGENAVYSSIVFNYDLDGDGTDDIYPSLAGLREIQCGPATGLASEADKLRIDCALVEVTGNLDIEGTTLTLNQIALSSDAAEFTIGADAKVEGDLIVEGDAEAERFISTTLNGGQDLNAGIYDAQIRRSGTNVTKPICPPSISTPEGEYAVAPRIYVVPAAHADAAGTAVVGLRAFAQDLGSEWRVRLVQYVNRDEYTLTGSLAAALGTVVPGGANRPLGAPGPDGRSDAYEVGSDLGRVLVMTRCY